MRGWINGGLVTAVWARDPSGHEISHVGTTVARVKQLAVHRPCDPGTIPSVSLISQRPMFEKCVKEMSLLNSPFSFSQIVASISFLLPSKTHTPADFGTSLPYSSCSGGPWRNCEDGPPVG